MRKSSDRMNFGAPPFLSLPVLPLDSVESLVFCTPLEALWLLQRLTTATAGVNRKLKASAALMWLWQHYGWERKWGQLNVSLHLQPMHLSGYSFSATPRPVSLRQTVNTLSGLCKGTGNIVCCLMLHRFPVSAVGFGSEWILQRGWMQNQLIRTHKKKIQDLWAEGPPQHCSLLPVHA